MLQLQKQIHSVDNVTSTLSRGRPLGAFDEADRRRVAKHYEVSMIPVGESYIT